MLTSKESARAFGLLSKSALRGERLNLSHKLRLGSLELRLLGRLEIDLDLLDVVGLSRHLDIVLDNLALLQVIRLDGVAGDRVGLDVHRNFDRLRLGILHFLGGGLLDVLLGLGRSWFLLLALSSILLLALSSILHLGVLLDLSTLILWCLPWAASTRARVRAAARAAAIPTTASTTTLELITTAAPVVLVAIIILVVILTLTLALEGSATLTVGVVVVLTVGSVASWGLGLDGTLENGLVLALNVCLLAHDFQFLVVELGLLLHVEELLGGVCVDELDKDGAFECAVILATETNTAGAVWCEES